MIFKMVFHLSSHRVFNNACSSPFFSSRFIGMVSLLPFFPTITINTGDPIKNVEIAQKIFRRAKSEKDQEKLLRFVNNLKMR